MPQERQHENTFTANDALLLAVIVGVGAFLRFYKLDFQSYWTDELWSIHTSRPGALFGDMWRDTVADVHPPLYQVLLWFWLKMFGFTEFSGRALSAVLGTLVIPASFCLGKKLFDKQTGLLAALVVALNIFFISYAQEARSYALLALLTVVCFQAFLVFLERQAWKTALVYGIAMALLLNTHYYGLLVVFVQLLIALHYMFFQGGRIRLSLLVFLCCVFCVSLIPFLSHLLANAGKEVYWMRAPGLGHLLYCVFIFYHNQLLVVLGGLLACFGVYRGYRSSVESSSRSVSMLLLWFGAGLVIPIVTSYLVLPNFTARNLTIIHPAFCLLVAYGIRRISKRFLQSGVIIAYAALSFLPLFVTYDYYDRQIKMPCRELVQDVIAHSEGAEIYILGEEKNRFNVYFRYYLGKGVAKSENELLLDMKQRTIQPRDKIIIIDTYATLNSFDRRNDLRILEKHAGFWDMCYYLVRLKE